MRFPTCARAALMAALIGASRATPAQAQVSALPDTGRAAGLPAIVVTATRVPFAAVTAAATVLSGESLRRQGISNLADALRTVPGLTVVQTSSPGTRTSLYMRGGESGYTRVLIDGVVANDPGGEFDYAHLSTDHIDRVEIIRGPSSVLYGTDAVTGVIQVFTREGRGRLTGSAEARAGTYGARALSAAVHGGATSTAYSIGIGYNTTDGIHAFNSSYDRTSLSGNVRVRRGAQGDARLAVHYSDATTHVPTDGTGAPVDRNAYQHGERLTIALDGGRAISRRVDVRVSLASHSTDGGFEDAPDGVSDTTGFFASSGFDQVSRRSMDIRTNVGIAHGMLASAGVVVEAQRQHGRLDSQSEWGPSHSDTRVGRNTTAGYLQVLGTTGAAAWNLSARLDDSDAFGTFTTWRAGVAYDLGAIARVRAVAGRAFREPTFFQNFATGFVTGNPDLRPEQSGSWEVGVDRRIGNDRALISATWFDQRFTDLIEYTYTGSPGDPNYVNVAGARARGLELSLHAALFRNVALTAGYTWLDGFVSGAGIDQSGTGFFVTGAALLRRPAHSGSARLAWRNGRGDEVSVQGQRQGRRDDLDYAAGRRAVLGAHTVVDVAAFVHVTARPASRRRVSVSARVSNALGEEYQAVLGFATPGRALNVGLRLE